MYAIRSYYGKAGPGTTACSMPCTRIFSRSPSRWGNYRLVSDNPDFAGEDNDFDEYDHEVYLNYALNDNVDVELGYIYYYYPSTPSGTDTQEVYAGINVALNDYLSAGLKAYYDFDEGEGVYANLGIGAEYPLSDAVSATASAALGYMDYDSDYYVEGGISDFSDRNNFV